MNMGNACREKHTSVKGSYFMVRRKEHVSFNNVFANHPDMLPEIGWFTDDDLGVCFLPSSTMITESVVFGRGSPVFNGNAWEPRAKTGL